MNKRCDLCKHWDYNYPDDVGKCNTEPGKGVGLFVKYRDGKYRTSCTTYCENWESDGTNKAQKVLI